MRTYNFVVFDKSGNHEFIEINANSEEEAWRELLALPIDITYIDLIP